MSANPASPNTNVSADDQQQPPPPRPPPPSPPPQPSHTSAGFFRTSTINQPRRFIVAQNENHLTLTCLPHPVLPKQQPNDPPPSTQRFFPPNFDTTLNSQAIPTKKKLARLCLFLFLPFCVLVPLAIYALIIFAAYRGLSNLASRYEANDPGRHLSLLLYQICAFLILLSIVWPFRRGRPLWPFSLFRSAPTPAHQLRLISTSHQLRLSKPAQTLSISSLRHSLPLSDLRYFRTARLFHRRTLTQNAPTYAIEAVAINYQIIFGDIQHSRSCAQVVRLLNLFLQQSRLSPEAPVPIPPVFNHELADNGAVAHVTPQTPLYPLPPPQVATVYTFTLSTGAFIFRIIRRSRFPSRWLILFTLGILWQIGIIAIAAYNASVTDPLGDILSDVFVIISLIFSLLPAPLILLSWARGQRWVFAATRASFHPKPAWSRGLLNSFFAHTSCRMADVARMQLYLRRVRTVQMLRTRDKFGTHVVGGRRFGVRLTDAQNVSLFSVEPLTEGEAIYIAHVLREYFPHLAVPV